MKPSSIPVGEKGIVWGTGAASYFICERSDPPPAVDADWPNSYKYIELNLSAQDPPNEKQAKKALTALMQEFAAFTKKELKCEA